jgi:hypothetical protein
MGWVESRGDRALSDIELDIVHGYFPNEFADGRQIRPGFVIEKCPGGCGQLVDGERVRVVVAVFVEGRVGR